MQIATTIIEHRTQAGVSQRHLADMLGVDRSAVSRWESAKRVPHWRRIADIAQALEVPLEPLLAAYLDTITALIRRRIQETR